MLIIKNKKNSYGKNLNNIIKINMLKNAKYI